MRKNIFRGLIAVTLGLAMAVGVGAGISSNIKKTNPIYADYSELYSADFTSVADHSYTQNKTFTLSNKSWTSSVSQVSSSVFYLGCNSNNASKGVLGNNATFNAINTALVATGTTYTSGTSHAYALLFDNSYNGVTKVVFNWSGGNNAFQVYLFGKTSLGYTQLGYTNYATSGASTAGNVTWTGNATNYLGFAIAAKPGTPTTNATNKTLRASSFYVYETESGGEEPPEPSGYTVSFNANGGSGSMSSVNNLEAGDYELPSNGFTAPSGKAFIGWKANNSGDLIPAGNSYNVTANVTFYAQWANTYSVTYNANGGTGTVTDSNSPYVSGATVTVKSGDGLTAAYPDEVFDKWNTAANGSGTDYAADSTFSISANTTLYAQWKDDPTIPYTNVYSSDFELAEDFPSGSNYQSTAEVGPNGKKWTVYYGTSSATNAIDGSQSLQMRWYSSPAQNIPYAQTDFQSIEVKTISFKYQVNNANVNFKVQYKSNIDDENWTDIETVDTADTSIHAYKKIFNTPIPSFYLRILACGSAPNSGHSRLYIDNVRFKSVATPATINGKDTVQVGTQWSPTSIAENAGEHTEVTGATYSFTTSNGATISSSNPSTGAFTCSSAGTVTVNATKSGYLITGKTVTVQPANPFVNEFSKTSTSGYTGQTETISVLFRMIHLLLPLMTQFIVLVLVPLHSISLAPDQQQLSLKMVPQPLKVQQLQSQLQPHLFLLAECLLLKQWVTELR